jgi:hypothetical protein
VRDVKGVVKKKEGDERRGCRFYLLSCCHDDDARDGGGGCGLLVFPFHPVCLRQAQPLIKPLQSFLGHVA